MKVDCISLAPGIIPNWNGFLSCKHTILKGVLRHIDAMAQALFCVHACRGRQYLVSLFGSCLDVLAARQKTA